MSYSIVYTSKDNSGKTMHKRFKIIAIAFLLAAVFGLLYHNTTILHHAFPIFREEVTMAFSNMLNAIKNGVPVGEAAVAFGQEIIFA